MDSHGGGSSDSGEQGRSGFYTPEQRDALMHVNRLRYVNVQQRGLERHMSDNNLLVMQGQFDRAEEAMENVGRTLSDVLHASGRRDPEAYAEAAARHYQAVAEWVDRGTVFHERARQRLDARGAEQEVTQRNAAQRDAAQRDTAEQQDLPQGQGQWLPERFTAADAVMSGGLVDQQLADEQFLSAEDYALLHEPLSFDAVAPAPPLVDQEPMTPGIAAPVPVFQPLMASDIPATAPVPPAQSNVAQALAGQGFYGQQPQSARGRTDNAGYANGSGINYPNGPRRPSSSPSPRRSASPGR